MVGVANPLIARSPAQRTRFVSGLAFGILASSAVLSLVLSLVADIAHSFDPEVRAVAGSLVLGILLAADLLNRTPDSGRQVPQRFIRALQPGVRGLAWGFDLGLIATTRKTSSLPWLVLLVVPLSGRPVLTVACVLCCNGLFLGGLIVQSISQSISLYRTRLGGVQIFDDIRRTRLFTGLVMLTTLTVGWWTHAW
jgi:hypothetical protein